MRAGARAPALHLPFPLLPLPSFSYRRALMFLFEKRAFLPLAGRSLLTLAFVWMTCRVWPGVYVTHRHSRSMCLCPTLAMRGPPVRCFRPVLFRAVHHYVSSTLRLYLALTPN